MSSPVRFPVHQSLLRPILVLGGERELVLGSGLLATVLIVSLGSIADAVVGVLFWLVALAALQRLAKIDPQFSLVYRRHINRRLYYPARPHVCAAEPEIRRQQ